MVDVIIVQTIHDVPNEEPFVRLGNSAYNWNNDKNVDESFSDDNEWLMFEYKQAKQLKEAVVGSAGSCYYQRLGKDLKEAEDAVIAYASWHDIKYYLRDAGVADYVNHKEYFDKKYSKETALNLLAEKSSEEIKTNKHKDIPDNTCFLDLVRLFADCFDNKPPKDNECTITNMATIDMQTSGMHTVATFEATETGRKFTVSVDNI